jgi:hypothetical protein
VGVSGFILGSAFVGTSQGTSIKKEEVDDGRNSNQQYDSETKGWKNLTPKKLMQTLYMTFNASILREVLKVVLLPGFGLLVLQARVNMVKDFNFARILIWLSTELLNSALS